MKLLNLCCGGNRPQDELWYNLDDLHDQLELGSPERLNLDAEPRYTNANVLDFIPFRDNEFDGILASHCFEHWNCKKGVKVMRDCLRTLKPEGILMVSVPDASYFRLMSSADTIENAVSIFGEEIYLPDMETTFFGYALWNRFHHAILTEDAVWAYFKRSGFKHIEKIGSMFHQGNDVVSEMHKHLNRRLFSLVMIGTK